MQRRDSQVNTERIVEALRLLWAEDAAPSMEQIAARAGVGVATVYRHFPNRAALESAAFSRIFAEELAPLIAPDLHDDLLDVAERFVEVGGRYSPILGAVGISTVTDEALDGMAEPFIALLRDGQASGILRKDLEPIDIYWVIRMLVLGLNSPLSSAQVRRRYSALMLAALAPGDDASLPALGKEDYDRMSVRPEHRT